MLRYRKVRNYRGYYVIFVGRETLACFIRLKSVIAAPGGGQRLEQSTIFFRGAGVVYVCRRRDSRLHERRALRTTVVP